MLDGHHHNVPIAFAVRQGEQLVLRDVAVDDLRLLLFVKFLVFFHILLQSRSAPGDGIDQFGEYFLPKTLITEKIHNLNPQRSDVNW